MIIVAVETDDEERAVRKALKDGLPGYFSFAIRYPGGGGEYASEPDAHDLREKG